MRGQDSKVNTALLSNLDALRVARVGEDPLPALKTAREFLDSYINEGTISADEVSRASRYRSQVAINEARIRFRDGDERGAFAVMLDNVEFCRERSFDYLSEALCEASYLAYLIGDFDSSTRLGEEGFWRTYLIGSVRAIKTIREIIVSPLYKSGELERAENVASLIESDPLGLRGLHD